MAEFCIPYGPGHLAFSLPERVQAKTIEAQEAADIQDPLSAVERALAAPVGDVGLAAFRGARSAAIAINDKTRAVPHRYLLPPLMQELEALGIARSEIRLLIATGAHPPMLRTEFPGVLPRAMLARYPVLCHDADEPQELVLLGMTTRGTPVWVNRHFVEADLRIVVGNIEPHQFMGFSGGVKSAAIGLAGRQTIERNHAMMTHPSALLGSHAENPVRQDVEEMGRVIGIHFALNAVLTGRKEIAHVIAGEPRAVMEAGIPLCREVCQVAVSTPFDLVIASPGGHPHDLNLYQSQKALSHSGQVTRDGGQVILAAACPEGIGSLEYEARMQGMRSHRDVLAHFAREPFHLGSHKAFLVSRDAARLRVLLVSDMSPARVRRMLLTPAASLREATEMALAELPTQGRVAVMPRASFTIPYFCRGS
jgi:nickel-dependent lactate racemase